MTSQSGDTKPLNSSPSIWVVDDDVDDQFLIQSVFGEFTPLVDIHFLRDGQELVEHFSQNPLLPKLVLLDLNMPRLGGFETLAWLRQQKPFQNLPVAILTTSSHSAHIQKAFELGANGYFVKPIRYEDFILIGREIIQQWL